MWETLSDQSKGRGLWQGGKRAEAVKGPERAPGEQGAKRNREGKGKEEGGGVGASFSSLNFQP
jgi:hypothetical protein